MSRGINFSSLIQSVSYWLCFQARIGRQFMINEGSLKYPIADFFTNHHFPVDNINLEYNHPIFKQRQIDVVLKEKDYLKTIFELKIASYNTKTIKEKKRIFNDLVRLHFLNKIDENLETYFIISGGYTDFQSFFRNISDKKNYFEPSNIVDQVKDPSGFYTKWFSFKKDGVKVIDTQEEDEEYRSIYKNFFKEYEVKEDAVRRWSIQKELPQYITTKCIDISPLDNKSPLPYLTGIWKII